MNSHSVLAAVHLLVGTVGPGTSGGGRKPHDWYGVSLLMTPVDGYDTMLLMGLRDEAADAKRLILDRLSFDRNASVQVFEVTIRLLGGLLSGYEMDGDPRLLRLARDLADRLLPAFRSPTGMPFRYVNLRTGATRDPVSNPAEIGTLMLEFGTLARLTGRPVYYDTAKRAVQVLFARRSPLGLVGSSIDVRTGDWVDSTSHVGGGIDSWYEYLLKSWRLFGDDDFRRMWEASVAPMHRYLADEPGYELRPESLESAYYLFRLTGDERYRRMGPAMWSAIDRWTRTDAGFAALGDVRTRTRRDRMHSFLFAETLKYAYLLLAPAETLDLSRVIFNTEAHPLRLPDR